MKTYLKNTAILPLAVMLLSTALPAAPQPAAPVAFPVTKASSDGISIELGATRKMVAAAFDAPSVQLSPDIWLYHRQHAVDSKRANEQSCRTLVVTFTNGLVSDLKLVNRPAVDVIAANLKSSRTSVKYVADKR